MRNIFINRISINLIELTNPKKLSFTILCAKCCFCLLKGSLCIVFSVVMYNVIIVGHLLCCMPFSCFTSVVPSTYFVFCLVQNMLVQLKNPQKITSSWGKKLHFFSLFDFCCFLLVSWWLLLGLKMLFFIFIINDHALIALNNISTLQKIVYVSFQISVADLIPNINFLYW